MIPVGQREPGLSDEEYAIQQTARRFALDVMRPAGVALDRLPSDAVIAPDSPLFDVHRQYRELGLNLVEIATEASPQQLARFSYLVSEELGYGDLGLGWSCYAATFPAALAQASGNAELMERFTFDQIGCWGVTEPNHGSDQLDFTGAVSVRAAAQSDCVVRRDGDTLRIEGQKSAWCSNGSIAETMSLFCRYDDGSGHFQQAAFLVPLDLPGISRGKPLTKLGVRSLTDAEIYFDGVEIPLSYLAIPPEAYRDALAGVLIGANPSMAVFMVGLGRAAFEHALAYARERVQGGKPIIEHANVRLRLFEIYRKLNAARALCRQVMETHAVAESPYFPFAASAKVTGTTLVWEAVNEAFEVFGGNAQTAEYPIEKLLRDARLGTIADGTNDVLSLMAASQF